jgi:hypothetical protein
MCNLEQILLIAICFAADITIKEEYLTENVHAFFFKLKLKVAKR